MKKIVVNGEIYKDKYIDINSYIVDYNGSCFIVDPGFEKERIIKLVEENNLRVEGIILTHSHLDHTSAIDCFDVPVYVSENEYELLVYNHENQYRERELRKPFDLKDINIVKIKKNEKIPFLDKYIEVIPTPGHTIGGLCYKFENDLYSGDTLFKGAVGRSDFKTGDINALKKSVVTLISNLDDEINVHPGHIDSTTIGFEKKYNQYYNAWK